MQTTESDKPRVQIPLGADHHGLSIDGEFVFAWPDDMDHPGDEDLHPRANYYLPKLANEAYWNHYSTDNLGRVYQCTECGYLTMSKKARRTAYRKAKCTNCKKDGKVSTSWTHVYPDPVAEENKLDVPSAVSEQAEFNPEKPLGPEVPNHPSHLSRIKNQVTGHVTRGELLEIVATAVKEARKKGQVPY